MKNKVIEVSNLNFKINDNHILKNIDLNVDEGEFIGLIGPNGAGKTTLLKSLNGINKCDGTINLHGKNIETLNDKEIALKVGLMHQNTTVTFPFPAEEIVLMGRYPHLKRTQSVSSKDRDIAKKHMEFTDTYKLKHKPINQMSGGERQRVLFAKVLTQETDIILLDEPTASLDITHEEQIFKFSKELSQKGKTVIAAVHDLKIAAKYCTRLVLMSEGRISSIGTPQEVLTADNLKEAYKVNAVVYDNPFSNLIDFYIYEKKQDKKKIHIICGGGSGSKIIHYLFNEGYNLSCGILGYGDTDLITSEIMGIRTIKNKPFNDISKDIIDDNIQSIRNSDVTILTNIYIGNQNIDNLKMAKYSKNLIIIEDTTIGDRDFTDGEGKKIYEELKSKARVITSNEISKIKI